MRTLLRKSVQISGWIYIGKKKRKKKISMEHAVFANTILKAWAISYRI